MLALLGEGRGATLVRQELRVAATAATAAGRQPAIAVVRQVGEHLTGVHVVRDRALGHLDLERLAALAVLILALAVHAVGRTTVRVVLEREQRRDVAVGDEPDVAAVAAVATVRAAERLGALATERHTAGSAVTTTHVQLDVVDEIAHRLLYIRLRSGLARRRKATSQATGSPPSPDGAFPCRVTRPGAPWVSHPFGTLATR